ncbi:MAG: helix-turn-helix transcriptional regulator [Clostridia bacterium]|nr:helix-turn-helix transcriptional regulator [Clostridia bacterium]
MRFNESIIYTDTGNAVIKAFHSSVPPTKREYNEHHHTECELSLFIKGSGIYSVGKKQYRFSHGDMFLFGSNEAHCITDIYEELDLLNIHFEPRLLWEHSDNVELLSLFNSRGKGFENRFQASDTRLKELILGIEKEMSERSAGYRIQTKYTLFSALVHIVRTYDCVQKERALQTSATMTESLKRAMVYIDANLESKLTLHDIAETACMTETYFSSVFKKFNGISPWEYIMIKRVEKAIEMLRSTELTKLEIAEKCGFTSSSNFYKIFFNVTGKKPGDYIT